MNSPISRVGGKKLLRKTITDMFPPAERFNRYIEVFGGAGWVLFYKEKYADLEVYNDADGELVNMMRCIKYHCAELQREIDGYFNSREMFQDVSDQLNCRGLTDIQRAARYFVKMRISFGADGRTFGCSRKPLKSATDYLSQVKDRLYNASVVIEHKDFEALIKLYDRPTALMFLDPPYHGTEKYYDAGFTQEDHERLKRCLNGVSGLFLLTYNDDEYIRELYKDYNITPVERANNLSGGKYRELIITNY